MVISGCSTAGSGSNSSPTRIGLPLAREFRHVRRCDMNEPRFWQSRRAYFVAAFGLLLAISPANAQRAYQTPDEAASALADAIKAGATRDVMKVLGAEAEGIIFSGDEVADRE